MAQPTTADVSEKAPVAPATEAPPPAVDDAAAADEEIPAYEETAAVVPIYGLGATEQPTGVFESSSKEIILRLFDQKDNSVTDVPAYGRGSTVRGEIELAMKDIRQVKAVSICLDGLIRLDSFDGFPSKRVFVKSDHRLWAKTKEDKRAPKKLSFQFDFPSDEQAGLSLPPSYITPFGEISSLLGKIIYKLEVTLKTKKLKVKSETKLRQDVNYYPRSAPPEAFTKDYRNFDLADNWAQTTRLVRPKIESKLEPLTCDFYIPASRTFGITQLIPFHLTITGTKPGIDTFLPSADSSPDEAVASNGDAAGATPSKLKHGERSWKLKVQIVRKISIKPKPDNPESDEVSREAAVGNALVHSLSSTTLDDGKIKVEFGGEIKCSDNVRTPAIVMDGLTERDFIILSVNPHNKELIARRCAFPISLVTDGSVSDTTQLVPYPMKDRIKGAVLYGVLFGCVIS